MWDEHTVTGRFGALATETAPVKVFGPTFVRLAVGDVERASPSASPEWTVT